MITKNIFKFTVYDPLADRFVMSKHDNPAQSYILSIYFSCLAVSSASLLGDD